MSGFGERPPSCKGARIVPTKICFETSTQWTTNHHEHRIGLTQRTRRQPRSFIPSAREEPPGDSVTPTAYALQAMAPRPLVRIRKICLVLPEAYEEETWGAATFRVQKKIFALVANGSGTTTASMP